MSIRNHYVNATSKTDDVVRAAVYELVAQQARIVAADASKGVSYNVESGVKKLVRFAEVLEEVR